MSSDPIEVLREVYWAGWLNASTWANRDDQLDDRGSEAYKKLEGEAVQPAIASLSAPKPPSVNDNAVAVNESAPVNDKPESAEAVPAGYVQIAKPALREMIGDERMAQLEAMCVYPTAPPRPEASAPVGVEGRMAEVVRFLMGEAPLEGRWFDDPGDPHSGSAYWWRKHLTEAIAQQPAAPTLAKHQPCGCVICTCEDEQQCRGCGAKHCGNRTDHPPYVVQQPAAERDLEEREQRDEALLRQALGRAHQTAMEQTLKARTPECAEFAGIAQDLDFVVAALRERLGVKA